jgi:hypothetical protein
VIGRSVNSESIIPLKRRREIVCSGGSVGAKEGDKVCSREVYGSKGFYKFGGAVNRLRDNEIGSWCDRLWTSNKEWNLRRAWTDAKTEGSSELNTIQIMLVEH